MWHSDVPFRNDKLMGREERDALLRRPLVIEEKIDGANVGISFSEDLDLQIQNRGQWITKEAGGQFVHLQSWIGPRCDQLFDLLGTLLILFGEWCYARHSVAYDRLPDWFVAFDVYDRKQSRFWSTERRDELAYHAGIPTVPRIAKRTFTESELVGLLNRRSAFGTQNIEGMYLRNESDGFLDVRAKLVHPSFIQQMGEHWSQAPRLVNRIDYSTGQAKARSVL